MDLKTLKKTMTEESDAAKAKVADALKVAGLRPESPVIVAILRLCFRVLMLQQQDLMEKGLLKADDTTLWDSVTKMSAAIEAESMLAEMGLSQLAEGESTLSLPVAKCSSFPDNATPEEIQDEIDRIFARFEGSDDKKVH